MGLLSPEIPTLYVQLWYVFMMATTYYSKTNANIKSVCLALFSKLNFNISCIRSTTAAEYRLVIIHIFSLVLELEQNATITLCMLALLVMYIKNGKGEEIKQYNQLMYNSGGKEGGYLFPWVFTKFKWQKERTKPIQFVWSHWGRGARMYPLVKVVVKFQIYPHVAPNWHPCTQVMCGLCVDLLLFA